MIFFKCGDFLRFIAFVFCFTFPVFKRVNFKRTSSVFVGDSTVTLTISLPESIIPQSLATLSAVWTLSPELKTNLDGWLKDAKVSYL